jgi:hypothetical protein
VRNLAILLVLFCFVLLGKANVINPDFDGAPAGWVTDRYQPNVFADIGSFQGRSDVLQIGINAAQGMGSRPSGQNTQFYNTQGMQYLVSGGVGSSISADLWIPEEWRSELNGSRRTDIWGIMTDGTNVTGYPILGFTNYGGTPTFRAWEDTVGSWQILANPIQYNAWNTLAIVFQGTSYEFYVNGSLAWTDNTANGSTGFRGLIMQAYNFNGDGSLNAVTAGGTGNYSVHWANTSEVPEPGTILLSGLGLLALGLLRRRQQRQ